MRELVKNIKEFLEEQDMLGKVSLSVTNKGVYGFEIEAKAKCGCKAKWVNTGCTELTIYSKSVLKELFQGHGPQAKPEAEEGLKAVFDMLDEMFGVAGGPPEPEQTVNEAEPTPEPAKESDEAQAAKLLAEQLNRLLRALDTDPSSAEAFGVEAVVSQALANAGYYKDRVSDLLEELETVRANLRVIRKQLKDL